MHRFSSLRSDEDSVAKCRRRHDDKACDPQAGAPRAPQAVLVQYAEEPKEAQHSQRG